MSLRHALDLCPHYADAANLSGLILYRKDRFAEALAFFDISVHADPDQADALQMRALMLQKLGRLEQSIADGARSAQLDPTNPDTTITLAASCMSLTGSRSLWRVMIERSRFGPISCSR